VFASTWADKHAFVHKASVNIACHFHHQARAPKTKKEFLLKGLIERKGKKCAAVALANKTVRTAFAMITQGTEYKAELLAA